MSARNIVINMHLTPEQKKVLDKLAELTRIPRAVLVREAIDDLLRKHAKTLKGAKP